MGNETAAMLFSALATAASALAAAVAAAEFEGAWLARLVKAAAAAALIALCALMVLLATIGRLPLIFGVLANPGSALFWEIALAALLAIALAGYCASQYVCEERTSRVWLLFAAAASLLLPLSAGQALVMPFKPLWNTELITLAFPCWAALGFAACRPWVDSRRPDGTVPMLGAAVLGCCVILSYAVFALQAEPQALSAMLPETTVLVALVAASLLDPFFLAPLRQRWASLTVLVLACAGAAAFHGLVFRLGMPAWHFF